MVTENKTWIESNELKPIEGLAGLKDQIIQIKCLLMAWTEVSLDNETVRLLKEKFLFHYDKLKSSENEVHL